MTNDRKPPASDERIARLFEAKRRADEAGAPAFEHLLARRPHSGVPAIRRFAFSAAVLVAVVAAVLLIRRPAPPGVPAPETAHLAPAAIQLAYWKAPTDVFLDTFGSDLWSRLPVLVSSERPLASPTLPAPTKGASR